MIMSPPLPLPLVIVVAKSTFFKSRISISYSTYYYSSYYPNYYLSSYFNCSYFNSIHSIYTFTISTLFKEFVSLDGGSMPLLPLTLYDLYFHLSYVKSKMKSNLGYIFNLHDDFSPLDIFSPSKSSGNIVHLNDGDVTHYDHIPIWEPQCYPHY